MDCHYGRFVSLRAPIWLRNALRAIVAAVPQAPKAPNPKPISPTIIFTSNVYQYMLSLMSSPLLQTKFKLYN